MTNPPKHPSAEDCELRSFGRKRGRGLSARQRRLMDELLPRVALDLTCDRIEPATHFDRDVRDIWREIGFGGAEHLIWQAERHPETGFIGCEPFEDGVVKALTAIEEGPLDNVRLHAGDARDVLRLLPDASLGRVFILFPDPWPKRKHVKRRLVSVATLRMLARVMRPGAELRIALPFVRRDDVDLARHGDELVVTVGSYRRLLSLPAALSRHRVTGARVEDGALRVRFRIEEEQP